MNQVVVLVLWAMRVFVALIMYKLIVMQSFTLVAWSKLINILVLEVACHVVLK